MSQEKTFLSPEEAAARLLAAGAAPTKTEQVPLPDALGRVAAEDLHAPIDQPPFHRSPMDGYAVRSGDTAGADGERPVSLRVVGALYAGMAPERALCPGEAVRIMTGAPIPPGADCVVKQEDTDYGMETVRVFHACRPHENFCDRGEDTRQGELCVRRGERIDSARVGLLAMLGYAQIPVFQRPVIGILATGDELLDVGRPLAPGKIYNSNQYLLSSRILELGAVPRVIRSGPDEPDVLAETVEEALRGVDLLITTGGVSVGARDFMPAVCEKLQGELLFKGVGMKPGSPAMAFRCGGKTVLCLSGNPFAAAATFELLARPLIALLQGCGEDALRLTRTTAFLHDAFPKASRGRRFIRARIEGKTVSLPQGGTERHSSGTLSSMVGCNCMIDIPAGSPGLRAGEEVSVVLL